MGVRLVLLRHGEGGQLSIVTTGSGLGIALGPLITGMLATVRFELPFIIGGVRTLVGAPIVYRCVPGTVHRAESSAVKVHGAVQPVDSK